MPTPTPAMFSMTCPGCRAALQVPTSARGKSGRCPHCRAALTIPAEARTAPAPRDSAPHKPLPAPKPRHRATEDEPDTDDGAQGSPWPLRICVAAGGMFLIAAVALTAWALNDRKRGEKTETAAVETDNRTPIRPKADPARPAPVPMAGPREPGTTVFGRGLSKTLKSAPSFAPAPKLAPPAVPAEPPPAPSVAVAPMPRLRDLTAILEEAKRAVVLIEGKYGRGSGFLIAPDVVVTNSHVVLCEMMENVTVRFATNGAIEDKGVKAKLLYEDKKRDLVLLQLDQPQTRRPLALAKGFQPDAEPELYVIGSPAQLTGGALGNVVEKARCERDVPLIGGKSFYLLNYATRAADIRIGRGNSGGPAINERGEVVGVVTLAEFGRDRRPTGKAYCIPVHSIEAALAELGDRSGWVKHSNMATALHARDIAIIATYVDAKLAHAIVIIRVVAEANGPEATKAFQPIDKRLNEMADLARKVALAGDGPPGWYKLQIRAMHGNLNTLRALTKQLNLGPMEEKMADKCIEQIDQVYERFLKDCGMNGEVIQMMLIEMFQEAGIKVTVK